MLFCLDVVSGHVVSVHVACFMVSRLTLFYLFFFFFFFCFFLFSIFPIFSFFPFFLFFLLFALSLSLSFSLSLSLSLSLFLSFSLSLFLSFSLSLSFLPFWLMLPQSQASSLLLPAHGHSGGVGGGDILACVTELVKAVRRLETSIKAIQRNGFLSALGAHADRRCASDADGSGARRTRSPGAHLGAHADRRCASAADQGFDQVSTVEPSVVDR